MNTYVDIHIIQSVPPSCVNRDDSGSPKSAVYGGVRRLRVSSQAWKNATRRYFKDALRIEDLGMRTRRLAQTVATRISEFHPEFKDNALGWAIETINYASQDKKRPIIKSTKAGEIDESGTPLFFASPRQIDSIAHLAIDSHAQQSSSKVEAKNLKKRAQEALSAQASIDLALFGRMVASASDLGMDAACQVAHAISTHAAENEYDFFTAVDDAKASSEEEDAGAGMMGTVEFSSATLYRYATVNVDMLRENLGNTQATLQALEAFINGFCLSMPTGKQNTFANRTLPDTVLVTIRQDQPISLVGAFEQPVPADVSRGYLGRSVQALADHAVALKEGYGLEPLRSLVVSMQNSDAIDSLGERVSFADLNGQVSKTVEARLPEQERD